MPPARHLPRHQIDDEHAPLIGRLMDLPPEMLARVRRDVGGGGGGGE